MTTLQVANCPNQDLAKTNCVFLSPADHASLGGDGDVYLEMKDLVYTAKPHPSVAAGCVGLNSIQRRGLGVSTNEPISAVVFSPANVGGGILGEVTFEVDFVVKAKARGQETLDGPALQQTVLRVLGRQYLTKGQSLALEFQGENLLVRVVGLSPLDVGGPGGPARQASRGLVVSQTAVALTKAAGSAITLAGLEATSRNNIFKAEFSFEKMGIGGCGAGPPAGPLGGQHRPPTHASQAGIRRPSAKVVHPLGRYPHRAPPPGASVNEPRLSADSPHARSAGLTRSFRTSSAGRLRLASSQPRSCARWVCST